MTDEAVERLQRWAQGWNPSVRDGVRQSLDSLVRDLRAAETKAGELRGLRQRLREAVERKENVMAQIDPYLIEHYPHPESFVEWWDSLEDDYDMSLEMKVSIRDACEQADRYVSIRKALRLEQ